MPYVYSKLIAILFLTSWLGACTSTEIGSERWCEDLQEKLGQDLNFDDGAAYAKYCVLDMDSE